MLFLLLLWSPQSFVLFFLLFFFFFNDTATTEIYTFPTRRSSDLYALSRARFRGSSEGLRRPRELREHGCRRSRRSEEHTSELQSPCNLVCRILLEKKKAVNPRPI